MKRIHERIIGVILVVYAVAMFIILDATKVQLSLLPALVFSPLALVGAAIVGIILVYPKKKPQ
jgi:uncharacterized integral membrane protein